VLWSIVERTAERFERAANEALANPGSAAERLAAFARAHVAVVTADPQAATVFVHEWRNLSPSRRAAVLERRDAYEARLAGLIEAGIADRQLAAADPRLAAAFILTALNGVATWYRPDGRLSAAAIADQYADLCVRALMEASR
jgi:AcrR family transcriptional regulator